MNAIVDRPEMEVSRNEYDALNVIRIDKVLQSIPLRLIPGPTIGKLRGRIDDHRSEDDFPARSRCQETLF